MKIKKVKRIDCIILINVVILKDSRKKKGPANFISLFFAKLNKHMQLIDFNAQKTLIYTLSLFR